MSPFLSDSGFDATPNEPIQFPATPVAGGESVTGGLLLDVGGVDYFIPAGDHEESATFTSDEGMSILADTDGDGRIDYVSTVSFDGQWSAWRWLSPDAGHGCAAAQGEGADAVTAGDMPAMGDEAAVSNLPAAGDVPAPVDAPAGFTPDSDGGWRPATATGELTGGSDHPASTMGVNTGKIHPDYGEEAWNKDRWVCVERGQWG